jgi:epoxyqueuosine reductase
LFCGVKGSDTFGLVFGIELYHIEHTVPVFAAIEDGIAAGAAKELLHREVEVGRELQSEREVGAQLVEAAQPSVGLLPAVHDGVGFKLYIGGVVMHDAVKVVRVPGGDPLLCECTHLEWGVGHGVALSRGTTLSYRMTPSACRSIYLKEVSEAIQDGWTPELRDWLDAASREAGFDACGVAAVGGPDDADAAQEAKRFAAWVDAGRAGEMEYLKRRDERGMLVRSGLWGPMPWARSVVVCALNYNADASRSIDPARAGSGWIGRYAWSGRRIEGETGDAAMLATDYHEELLGRLRRIEAGLHARAERHRPQLQTRCYVDTGPVLERSYAAQAGVGWIGKNTCVINQRLGSWLLLGVIVTSLPVDGKGAVSGGELAATLLAPDRCGSCTRCIDACPTGALLGSSAPDAPREMDASRCIAYLTIEKKGAIEEDLRGQMGRQVFGCDICQDVCPWNRRAPIAKHEGMEARPELINPALEWLAAMDAKEFKRRFKGSPLERTGRKRLLRNVAIAMGNSGDARFMAQLDAWRAGEDPVLDETVRWAIARLKESSGQ